MTNQQLHCEAVRELLPWHWNGTLEAGEEDVVDRHLESCDACRGDFAGLVEEVEMYSTHVPTSILVGHAAAEPTPVPGSEIEEHLAECPACSEELELIQEGLPRETTDRPVTVTSYGANWRRLALVAALVAGVGLIGWLASSSSVREMRAHLDEPEVNVAVIELLPQEMLLRGGGDGAQIITVPPETERVTLALAAPGVGTAQGYEVELVDDEGERVWRLTGLRRRADGGFTLSVAAGDLGPGTRTLRVYATDRDEPIVTYRFDLALG